MASVNYKMKVVNVGTDKLNVRNGPGTEYESVGSLLDGMEVQVDEIRNINEHDWCHHSTGWSSGDFLAIQYDEETPEPTTVSNSTENVETGYATSDPTLEAYEPIQLQFQNDSLSGDTITNFGVLKGVHGLPFQFLPTTDTRISNYGTSNVPYGRIYTERILGNMPLLLLSPGRASFLEKQSGQKKTDIIKGLIDMIGGVTDSKGLESILDGVTDRLYTFAFAYDKYYTYVNLYAQSMAIYLGIGDEPFEGTTYKHYDWSKYVNNSLKGFFSGAEYVAFYIEAMNEVSESFSNSTSQSMLDTGINSVGDLAREAQFLLGAGGMKINALDPNNYQQTQETISKYMNKFNFLLPEKIVKGLSDNIPVIISGGHLDFPEVWKDSEYTKGYDVSAKFISPNGDKESIYLNCLIPLIHLLCLTLPTQMGANSYNAPFIVKGLYKGMFSIDMGIIGNLSYTKGGESAWTIDDLPTEISVNFSIKDLYTSLYMSETAAQMINNTCLLDFLANLCSIDINKPELTRKIELWLTNLGNKTLFNLGQSMKLNFSNNVSNFLRRSFGR